MRAALTLVTLLSKLTKAVCTFLALGLFALLGIQVIGRYVFNWSPVWATEGAQILFVWLCFLGFASASNHSQHISLGYLHGRLPSAVRDSAKLLATSTTAMVGVVVIFGGVALIERLASAKTSGMEISVTYLYAAPVVGGTLIVFFETAHFIKHCTSMLSDRKSVV